VTARDGGNADIVWNKYLPMAFDLFSRQDAKTVNSISLRLCVIENYKVVVTLRALFPAVAFVVSTD
jgi:hypothetical protein